VMDTRAWLAAMSLMRVARVGAPIEGPRQRHQR